MIAEEDASPGTGRSVTGSRLRIVTIVAAVLLTVTVLMLSLLPYAIEQGGVVWLVETTWCHRCPN